IDAIKLSANWMAACGDAAEDADLFDAVNACASLCRELGIAIPVGKDSLSMRTVWDEGGARREVRAPTSLIVTAFAPVPDARQVLTPQLQASTDTVLILIDLGQGRQRLGASAFAQVTQQIGGEAPDIAEPALLAR